MFFECVGRDDDYEELQEAWRRYVRKSPAWSLVVVAYHVFFFGFLAATLHWLAARVDGVPPMGPASDPIVAVTCICVASNLIINRFRKWRRAAPITT